MERHEDLKDVVQLMHEQVDSLQKEFGQVLSGKNLIVSRVSYPEHPGVTREVKRNVGSLIEGALLVYLFAMWESHVPEDIVEWLNDDEKRKLNAYRHVRDSAAHGYKGRRAEYPARRAAFENEMPFSGIEWDRKLDIIDISNSSIALDCLQFMRELTGHLIARLYANKKPPEFNQ